MKVLFVAGFGNSPGIYGGQVTAARSLLSSPFSRRAEVILLDSTMKSIPPPSKLRRFIGAVIRTLAFLKTLELQKPDAVLIFAADGLSFLEKATFAYIASSRGSGVVLRMSGGGLPEQCRTSKIMHWFTRFGLRHCQRVICQSESWKDFFVGIGMEANKGKVIRNWVDDTPFRDFPCAAGAEGPVTLLFLGWLDRSKGVYELVEAIGRVLQSHPEVRAVIAGGGGELENLKSVLRQENLENIVSLPGWVDGQEKWSLLRECQIFILPTYFEGLPNALLEAMAAGAAVVSTSVGGIPEVVRHGENGYLVRPRDAIGLARSISFLIAQPSMRIAMGERNRKKVAEEFTIDKNWSLVAGLLNESARIKGKVSSIPLEDPA